MILNLFSIFDTSSSYYNTDWISSLIVFFVFLLLNNEKLLIIKKKISFYIVNEIKTLMMIKWTISWMPNWLYKILFLMMINFLSLLPYLFCLSSHLSFTMVVGLSSWLSHMVFMIQNYLSNFLSHLVPTGTPLLLIHFMVLIELVSNLMRPLTLCVRLMANMTAGHLILTLMSSLMPKLTLILTLILYLPMLMLMFLEIGVSLIQSYVYTMLDSLYSSELMK